MRFRNSSGVPASLPSSRLILGGLVEFLFGTVLFLGAVAIPTAPHNADAQSRQVKKKAELFREDLKDVKDAEAKRKQAILRADPSSDAGVDVQAPSVEFLKDSKEIKGSGGVLISGKGVQAQADSAVVNSETKDATLTGSTVFTGASGSINATSAFVNLDEETGEFKDAEFLYEEGGYGIKGRDVYKLSETRYKLFDSKFSTCHCDDGSCPWSIDSDEARITQEGYAHTYGTTIQFHGVPLFYSPYFAFPAKTERTSGLLVPDFGYSSEDGARYKQPLFLVIDDSSDITVSPFIQTRTRNGSEFDYRRAFSRYNNLHTRWYYSNERPRDGELRGIRPEGYYDASIDDDRIGGFYNQIWRAAPDAEVPYRLIADVHYTSDNLFLREIPDADIGDPTDRYTTSTVVARSAIGDYLTAEIGAEYNQTLLENQDLQFQRVPELSLSGLRSFRPFGFNPLGAKVVTRATINGTEFTRQDGYDGFRTDVNPSITLPFHFSNYATAYTAAGYRHTMYNLDDTGIPRFNSSGDLTEDSSWNQLDASQTRDVPYLGGGVSTSVERVFDLPEGNSLTYLTSLGSDNQALKLVRAKHVVEPFMKYQYVPSVDQEDLPQFDSLDRIRDRSLMIYGVEMSLLGRFVPRRNSEASIAELTPEISELPSFSGMSALSDFGESDAARSIAGDVVSREGEIRELANLVIKQGYDWAVANDGNDVRPDGVYPTTDVNFGLGLFPTKTVAFKLDTNVNPQESRSTSWGVGTKLVDDRNDSLWARYSWYDPTQYQDPTASQIDGGAELVLTERLKFGVYSRFDEKESAFISNKMALRILSSCNCWHLDLGFADKSNPDKQELFFTFTFGGLGDISQDIGVFNKSNNS